MTDEQLALPGLDDAGPAPTAMVEAARRTLLQLREDGQLTARHAAQAQLVLSLSAAVDAGARSGRASATAMAARELRETLLVLDPPPEDGGAGVDAMRDLRALVESLNAAAQAGQPLRVVR